MSKEANDMTAAAGSAQFVLPFPEKCANYALERFVVTESNREAWKSGFAWRNSDEQYLVICGSEGAGKTHLAHIIAEDPGSFQDWRYFQNEGAGEIVVFDNVRAENPRGLLSAIQGVSNSGRRLILAGRGQPGEWAASLKDLRTRLESMPRACLERPDETLLRVVLRKTFNDRQIVVGENVIEFIAPRIKRDFASAYHFVQLADSEAAASKEKISITLARRVIENMAKE